MIDLTTSTALVATLVQGVTDDQLDDPTPCPDMDVRTLLVHLSGLSIAFRDAASKLDGPTTNSPPDPSAEALPADWRTAIPQQLAELATAWQQPDAWTGMSVAGGQQMPGEVMGLVALDEVVLHGWDLASATKQPYSPDPEALGAVEEFVAGFPTEPEQREGMFGPVIETDPDVPQFTRVLALAGRDASWSA